MNIRGTEVGQDAIDAALLVMRSKNTFVCMEIEGIFARALNVRGEVPMRAADRLIQRERKAGNIVQSGKRGFWKWKDQA